jgi:hypothetical protein
MKLKFIVLLLLIGINLQAEQEGTTYSVAYVYMHMDYREYDENNAILDSEKSYFADLSGAKFGLDYRLPATDGTFSQLTLSLNVLTGTTAYTGAYLNNGSGYGSVTSTSANIIMELDGAYLYGVPVSDMFDVFGGVSLGYRRWERGLSSSQIEVYSWGYINPELGAHLAVLQSLDVTLLAGYKYGIAPVMTATGVQDTFKLGSANTLHSRFSVKYTVQDNAAFIFEYIYENQIITKSNTVYDNAGNGYLEPDSTAKNQYLTFGFAFKY